MKKKVYISGAISGQDPKKVKERFEWAERVVEQLGHEAVSPLRLCGEETDWHKCMLTCVAALGECDAVYFLDNPKQTDSYGVMIEGLWAEKLGLMEMTIVKEGGNEDE